MDTRQGQDLGIQGVEASPDQYNCSRIKSRAGLLHHKLRSHDILNVLFISEQALLTPRRPRQAVAGKRPAAAGQRVISQVCLFEGELQVDAGASHVPRSLLF